VTQLTKLGSGTYLLKVASHACWNPVSTELTRRDVVQHFGEKVVLAADEAGQVTLAEGATAKEEGALDHDPPKPIQNSGLYKVTDEETGKELVGFAVPNLLDVDGKPLPLVLFTNGSHSTVQADVLGVPAGDGGALPTAAPGGVGAFFSHTADGKLQAMVPVDLSGGSIQMPGEPTVFSATTFDGREVEVSVQPNIQTVMQSPEGRVLVPSHWKWTPLGAAEPVALVGVEPAEPVEPEPEKKQASVVVRGTEDAFSFEGPSVEKLAWEERTMVSLDDAMFLLAGLGVDQGYGVEKLAHALAGQAPQRVVIGRSIKTAAEQETEAMLRAQAYAGIAQSLRVDLMKEAAAIPDPSAVDSVLSLGFINPENVMTFVSYLPTLEEAQAKLCDLLLAARVGLSDVSPTALERAIRSTEEALAGLKVLAFQGN
jgi:hypothetical protein